MSTIIFGLLTLLLILVSGYLVLIILMQRASSNSGMGSALGGGAAESALGAGAGNVLTKGTIYGSVAFFVISFALYLGLLAQHKNDGPINTLPVEMGAAEDAATEPAEKSPLVSLPEGLNLPTATDDANQITVTSEGGTTTQVTTPQGSMIVTEDAIKVDAPAAETAPAEEAPAAEDATAPAAEEAAPESAETTAPAETNAE